MKKIKNPWMHKEGYMCFGCCPSNEWGLHLEFYEDGEDIVSFWDPQPQFQGWIDTLHGGIQALLLDEICGWVVTRKLQTTGVTSKMETQYLKPIKTTGGRLTLRSRIQKQLRNIAFIEAEIYNEEGTICTKATCTYFCASKEKAFEEIGFMGCHLEEEEEA